MDNFVKQEGLKEYFEHSHGYAVFPTIAKAGIVAFGGAGGKGDVYSKGADGTSKKVGESIMGQVSFGFQLGGQVYSEIIFFETESDFLNFTDGNFEFGADANVVALTASAGTQASTLGVQGVTGGLASDSVTVGNGASGYTKGMKVFSISLGGLMYQATISGQKFSFKSIQEE
jgi:lipid-binding SYLF domain-containing protein